MTWLYVSGLVVLLGAVVDAVLANRSADVAIHPVIGSDEPRATGDAASVERVLRDVDRLTLDAGDAQRTLQAPEFVRTADGFALRWQTDETGRVIDGTNRATDETSREAARESPDTADSSVADGTERE